MNAGNELYLPLSTDSWVVDVKGLAFVPVPNLIHATLLPSRADGHEAALWRGRDGGRTRGLPHFARSFDCVPNASKSRVAE